MKTYIWGFYLFLFMMDRKKLTLQNVNLNCSLFRSLLLAQCMEMIKNKYYSHMHSLGFEKLRKDNRIAQGIMIEYL